MTTCERRLFNDADGMRCSEPAGHAGAHLYRAAWADDPKHRDAPGEEGR